MGSEWKLTLIERLSSWTSYAFHMYKSRHQICNECMGSRHHTNCLVSRTVINAKQAVAVSSISWAAIPLANSTKAPEFWFTVGAQTSRGRSPEAAYRTRTLHFLNLHLWHALTTLLLTSTVPSDPSDFGERGIV